MATIPMSTLSLPDGNTYEIVDKTARNSIPTAMKINDAQIANASTNWDTVHLKTIFYGTDTLTNQPTSYGNVLSIGCGADGTEKSQLWFAQSNGSVYHRQGNRNGWSGATTGVTLSTAEDANGWKEMVDSYNFQTYIKTYVYPVGHIYISFDSTSPASLFGGTWTQITDRFLLAAGTTYTTAGSTGGASTHTHSIASHTHTITHTHSIASHTHTTAGHTLTVSEMPAHSHASYGVNDGTTVSSSVGNYPYRIYQDKSSNWDVPANKMYTAGGGASHSHGNTGGTALTTGGSSAANTGGTSLTTASGSSLPPYYVVYVWRRTA